MKKQAFSLIEMLVVLIVMVAIATVAVQTSSRFVDQARYEKSARTLDAYETALIGYATERDADGQRVVSGFVADMGRLPEAVDISGELQVSELWDDSGMPDFMFRSPTDDSDVRLACGWRGPYLQSGTSDVSLDGWGRTLRLRQADDSAALAGDSVAQVASLGQDGEAGGTGYEEDLEVLLSSGGDSRYESDLLVTVSDSSGTFTPSPGETVTVRVYYPDSTSANLASTADTIDATDLAGDHASLTGVPIGRRVLRAYYPSVGASTHRSEPVEITLYRPDEVVTLELVAYP